MYRYSAGDQAHILFSVGIKDASELSSLMQRLNDKNMPTQDLSGIEAAQVSHHRNTLHFAQHVKVGVTAVVMSHSCLYMGVVA